MRDWEFYWDVVSWTATVGMTLIRAYFLCCFVKPFLQKKKRLALAGIGYTAAMLVMAYYPEEINVMAAYAGGVLAGFGVVYFIDRRNVEQKFFLAVIFYLLKWVTSGIVLIPWQFFYDLLLRFFLSLPGSGAFGSWLMRMKKIPDSIFGTIITCTAGIRRPTCWSPLRQC